MKRTERTYHYDLRDAETGRYFADMQEWLSEQSEKDVYKQGDEISLPDAILYSNNCFRLRNCVVEELECTSSKNRFVMYLRVTREEIKPFGYIDWQRVKKRIINGVDWTGSDGWLKLRSLDSE